MIRAQQRAGGFANMVRPYVNVVRTKKIDPAKPRYDYLHEREWRVPSDVDLSVYKPFGVILAEPNTPGRFGGVDGDIIFRAAASYGELD
jgi:hypothetical protein